MTWTGANPAAWAQRQKEMVKLLPSAVVEAVANSMATRIGVGGFTPVDTGNLSRSVWISASPIQRDGPGYQSPNRQDYRAASMVAKDGNAAFISYRAQYAHRTNYGFHGADSLGRIYNQSGMGYLEANIARFPQIVSNVISRIRASQ